MRPWPRGADDRGRARHTDLFQPWRSARRAGIDQKTRAEALRPARRAIATPVMLVFMSFYFVPILLMLVGHNLPDEALVMVGLIVFAVIVPSAIAASFRLMLRAQRTAGMLMGLCPACGYPITELEPQADGCRVCPECGAAWKLGGSAGGSASRPSQPSR